MCSVASGHVRSRVTAHAQERQSIRKAGADSLRTSDKAFCAALSCHMRSSVREHAQLRLCTCEAVSAWAQDRHGCYTVASVHVSNILKAQAHQRQDICEGGLGRLRSNVRESAKQRLCTVATASGKPRSSVCARAQQRQGTCTEFLGHVCSFFSTPAQHLLPKMQQRLTYLRSSFGSPAQRRPVT
jgi:hypothetical protein